MAITAKQSMWLSVFLPLLSASMAIGISATPMINQAKSQTGNSEQKRQLNAIAKDLTSKRCYQSTTGAPIKGQPVSISVASLHSSCIYGNGWYGFLAVLDKQVMTIEIYTAIEVQNYLSTLKD